MSDLTYSYRTQIQWGERRRGVLGAKGLPAMIVTTPPEFQGESGF